jgi:hypothetical protein
MVGEFSIRCRAAAGWTHLHRGRVVPGGAGNRWGWRGHGESKRGALGRLALIQGMAEYWGTGAYIGISNSSCIRLFISPDSGFRSRFHRRRVRNIQSFVRPWSSHQHSFCSAYHLMICRSPQVESQHGSHEGRHVGRFSPQPKNMSSAYPPSDQLYK